VVCQFMHTQGHHETQGHHAKKISCYYGGNEDPLEDFHGTQAKLPWPH
jgi:hypothetical protein